MVIDILGCLIRRAASPDILQQLHPRRHVSQISPYTDDVLMFCHLTPSDTLAVKAILELFGHSSGLAVNFAKCSIVLVNCTPDDAAAVSDGLGCPCVDLPITYLGILLTI